MAKSNGYLKDPIAGTRRVQQMPSGLLHCADSMAGGVRDSNAILTFGAPGDPGERSSVVKSNFYGKAPDLFRKFQKESQR